MPAAATILVATSSPLTPIPSTAPSSRAQQLPDASQLAPTELATSSLGYQLPSSSSFIANTTFSSGVFGGSLAQDIPPAPAPPAPQQQQQHPPAQSVPLAPHEPLADGLDKAHLRYQAALDAIALKYAAVGAEGDDDEGEALGVADLVERFTARLVKDEPEDGEVASAGSEGAESEADEVDEDDLGAEEDPATVLLPRHRIGSSRLPDEDGLFRTIGDPIWCWVEPSAEDSSSIFALLLQHLASLTASLSSASHILLALPPGPTHHKDLSALHSSVLAERRPGQRVVSFDWVRDCARTALRLDERAYEVSLAPALPPPLQAAGGKSTPRKDVDGLARAGRRTPSGLSRLRVHFSAPSRLARSPSAASLATAPVPDLKLAIPAFKPKPEPPFVPLAPKAGSSRRAPLQPTCKPAQAPLAPPAPQPLIKPKLELGSPRPPLSATAQGKQRATPVQPDPPADVERASLAPASSRPSTRPRARLPGTGLSRTTRVPKLLSQIRAPPPAVPRVRPAVKREAWCEDDDGWKDSSRREGKRMRLREERSESFG